ncbi:hypothetical protein D3C78_1483920 [compost metagenome]
MQGRLHTGQPLARQGQRTINFHLQRAQALGQGRAHRRLQRDHQCRRLHRRTQQRELFQRLPAAEHFDALLLTAQQQPGAQYLALGLPLGTRQQHPWRIGLVHLQAQQQPGAQERIEKQPLATLAWCSA